MARRPKQDDDEWRGGDMSDKIIFLDMDGVLSSTRAWIVNRDVDLPDRWLDPVACKLLAILCEETGAIIVVSSTWRLSETRTSFGAILQRNYCPAALHEDWRTLQIGSSQSAGPGRGIEVREWMARHPEVTDYVILDDNTDFFPDQPLVLTDSHNGLGYEHFREARRILNRLPKISLL